MNISKFSVRTINLEFCNKEEAFKTSFRKFERIEGATSPRVLTTHNISERISKLALVSSDNCDALKASSSYMPCTDYTPTVRIFL
jgi:hypothetical protein